MLITLILSTKIYSQDADIPVATCIQENLDNHAYFYIFYELAMYSSNFCLYRKSICAKLTFYIQRKYTEQNHDLYIQILIATQLKNLLKFLATVSHLALDMIGFMAFLLTIY